MIVDDDLPGILGFVNEEIKVEDPVSFVMRTRSQECLVGMCRPSAHAWAGESTEAAGGDQNPKEDGRFRTSCPIGAF